MVRKRQVNHKRVVDWSRTLSNSSIKVGITLDKDIEGVDREIMICLKIQMFSFLIYIMVLIKYVVLIYFIFRYKNYKRQQKW